MVTEADTDILPGFLLERYRVEAILGENRFGITTHAFDTRTKRTVVIKVLKRPSAASANELRQREEQFNRELEAGARLGFHSHIVSVLDLILEIDNTRYLIIEHLPGGTVAARIARGPLPLSEALQITADAANGLQFAHEVGIVHTDVTPAHIFLTSAGRAKVGGFGLAHIEDGPRTFPGDETQVGMSRYWSPEQETHLQPTTDQFSLGSVLFEAVTGEIYKHMHQQDRVELLRELPDSVREILARMLAVCPSDRFASIGEVADSIAAIIRGTTADAMQLSSLPNGSAQALSARDEADALNGGPRLSRSFPGPLVWDPVDGSLGGSDNAPSQTGPQQSPAGYNLHIRNVVLAAIAALIAAVGIVTIIVLGVQ